MPGDPYLDDAPAFPQSPGAQPTGDPYLDDAPGAPRPGQPVHTFVAEQGRRSWEHVAADLRTHYGVNPEPLRQSHEQARHLEAARAEFAGWTEGPVRYLNRRAFGPASAIGTALETREYTHALRRLQAGNPEERDYAVIARYERQRANEQGASLPAQIAGGAVQAPGMVLEALAGGAILRGAGLAGRAGAPSLLGQVARGELGAAARALPGAALRNAPATALMPSMYVGHAAQNALEGGGGMTDLRNLAPAFALGYINTAVLGSLGRAAEGIPGRGVGAFLRRQALRGGLGVAEQAAADVLASAAHLETGYGLVGDLWNGRGDAALRRLVVQGTTFATYGALHEAVHGAPRGPGATETGTALAPREPGTPQQGGALGPVEPQRVELPGEQPRPRPPAPVMEALASSLSELRRRGWGNQAAGDALHRQGERLRQALEANPDLSRAQARAIYYGEADPALRRFGLALADAIPEQRLLPEPPPPPGPRGTGPGVSVLGEGGRAPEPPPESPPPPRRAPRVYPGEEGGAASLREPPIPPEEPPEPPPPRPRRPPPGTPGASLRAEGGGPPDQPPRPATAREQATALERQHLQTLQRLQDAQRGERALRAEQAMGLNRRGQIEEAQRQRKAAQEDLGRLERDLDAARTRAAQEEASARPLAGPETSPEPPGGSPRPSEAPQGPATGQPEAPPAERRRPGRPPQGVWERIRAEHPDWGTEQIGREAARVADELGIDKLTGFENGQVGTAREDATRAAIAHAGQGGHAVYVETDLANLGGLNAHAGHEGANRHYRAFAELLRAELEGTGGAVRLFRHGGDEMSATVTGVPQAQVDAALERVRTRAQEYARAQGLHEIPHPKSKPEAPRPSGTGLHAASAEARAGETPQQLWSRADKALEARKANVHGTTAETAGAPAPQGQPPGTPAGPGTPGREAGAGEPGAREGVPRGQAPQAAGQPSPEVMPRAQRQLARKVQDALTHEEVGTRAELFRHLNEQRARKGQARLSFKEVGEVLEAMEREGLVEKHTFGPQDDPIYVPVEPTPEPTPANLERARREYQESLDADVSRAQRRGRSKASVQRDVERDVQKARQTAEAHVAREGGGAGEGAGETARPAETPGPAQGEPAAPAPAAARGGEAAGDVVERQRLERLRDRFARRRDEMRQELQSAFPSGRPPEPHARGYDDRARIAEDYAGKVRQVEEQLARLGPTEPPQPTPAQRMAQARAAKPETILAAVKRWGGLSENNARNLGIDTRTAREDVPTLFQDSSGRKGRLDLEEVAERLQHEGLLIVPESHRPVDWLVEQLKAGAAQHLDAQLAREHVAYLKEKEDAAQAGFTPQAVASAEAQGRADHAAASAAAEARRTEDYFQPGTEQRTFFQEGGTGRPGHVGPLAPDPGAEPLYRPNEPGEAHEPAGGPGPVEEVEPGVLFSGPVRAGGPGGGRGGVNPFEIIATLRKLFGLPANVEGSVNRAFYARRPEAAVVGKMDAGEAPTWLHETAHHIAKTQALPLDPNTLPNDVFQGFRQFDYDPGRSNLRTSMQEGFAEWLRMRETDQLRNLTPQQQAAAAYAERLLASRKGVLEKLDRVREMFRQYGGQTPSEQFGGMFSRTGQPAAPQATRQESAADVARRAARASYDALLDDLGPARRAEAGVRGTFAPGERLSEVMATTRFRSIPMQNDMRERGVFGFDFAGGTGRQTRLGRGWAEITKGLTAQDLVDLERYMHALQAVAQHQKGAGYLSPEQQQQARQTLEAFARSPERMRTLEPVAQAITREVFNASLDAAALAGNRTRDQVERLKALNPFYVSTARVLDPEGWKAGPAGRKGEEPMGAPFLHRRTGSGEQVISLVDAVNERLRWTATMLNRQARDYALYRLGRMEGVGPWMTPPEAAPGATATEPASWPRDGTKPSYVMTIDGKPMRARVNDRSFYELITGIQGEGAEKALHGLVLVSRPFAQLVRAGATVLSPLWHARNFFRDPVLYLQRTISGKDSVTDFKDLMTWYGKSFRFYSGALFGGDQGAGDPYFRFYEQTAGRSQRYLPQPGLTRTGEVMEGWRGFYQRLTDALTFGETGTRVLEMKNRLDQLGFTRENVERGEVPFAAQVAALDVASQITHNVHQQGTWIRQLNKAWPFLGAHIAGAYKDVQAFRSNTAKALTGLAILATAKAVEWLLNKDDPEYAEMPPYRRDGFTFKTPLGWMAFPAPRGLNAPVVGIVGETLRATSQSNPRFGALLQHSLEGLGPHGGPEPFTTGAHLLANTSWTGRPIVPRGAESPNLEYRVPYAASQLSGGMLSPQRLTLNPFGMDQNPHQSVTDYFDTLHTLEEQRTAVRRRGLRFDREQQYQALHAVEDRMRRLARELRGEHLIGGRRTVAGERPPEDRQAALRRHQVALARQALEAAGR